jgi:hypothetical protein
MQPMNDCPRVALVCLITLMTGAFGHQAKAGLIAADGFDYSAGESIVGQNGGTGWADAWHNTLGAYSDFTVGPTSSMYPGLATSGGNVVGTGIGVADGRSLTAESNSFGDQVWIAFEAALSPSNFGFPSLRLYDDATAMAGIGGTDTPNWSLEIGGNISTTTPLDGANNLVVLEINYATNMTSLWMNPDLASFNGTQTPSVTADFAPVFNNIQIYFRSGDTLDELALGTSFSDVLPLSEGGLEGAPAPIPGTGALSLVAAVTLLAVRRPRKRAGAR